MQFLFFLETMNIRSNNPEILFTIMSGLTTYAAPLVILYFLISALIFLMLFPPMTFKKLSQFIEEECGTITEIL